MFNIFWVMTFICVITLLKSLYECWTVSLFCRQHHQKRIRKFDYVYFVFMLYIDQYLVMSSYMTVPMIKVCHPEATQISSVSNSMSLVVRKPVFGVSDQVRHKPGCAVIEDG